MKIIYNYIKLTRPLNCLITALVVFVGGIISSERVYLDQTLILASVVASVVAASGNVINDYFDIEIDKISHPERPLAKNNLKPSSALIYYSILLLIALTISFFLNTKLLSVVIFASTILFFYSFYLKKIPLVGNITVALLTALAFLFGGLAVNNFQAAIIPASFAFLINLIRELVKDAEDIEGDKLNNVITFPIKYGIEKTRNTITVLSLLLIALTIYPFIDHSYNIEYFVVVMIVVNPILVFILKKLFEDTSKQNLNFISSMLKITMIFGLIAIYLGK